MIVHIKGNQITMIYDERLDLSKLGDCKITRASYVEPNSTGHWSADMGPTGPILGPFNKRSEALTSERIWLENHLQNK
jgi:hypothetical protein